jgi:hypothetical protein
VVKAAKPGFFCVVDFAFLGLLVYTNVEQAQVVEGVRKGK